MIIGQPTLREFGVTLSMTCACENKNTLLTSGKVGMIFGCNGCQRAWRVEAMALSADGRMEVTLAEVRLTKRGVDG
jgi:hypothetical protein